MFRSGMRRVVSRAAQRRGASSHAHHDAHVAHKAAPEPTHAGRTALPHEIEESLHAETSTVTWKRISYFVALPAVFATAYATVTAPAHEQPPFQSYGTYTNVRNKPFPWGSGEKSLFWNDHVNHLSADEHHGAEEHHEEWKNPIAAWIEYHMTPEETLREDTHNYLRTMKVKAEANKTYSMSLSDKSGNGHAEAHAE